MECDKIFEARVIRSGRLQRAMPLVASGMKFSNTVLNSVFGFDESKGLAVPANLTKELQMKVSELRACLKSRGQ
jgi:hypothetical protein